MPESAVKFDLDKQLFSQLKKVDTLHHHKVVKSNALIQKSRYDLSLLEQKVILYLISKIKPGDEDFLERIFEISEFCHACGIDYTSGANYSYIKQTLKKLRDQSIWVTLEDGSETTLAWIDKVTVSKNSGTIRIRIDDMMKPFLLQLRERFTQYELMYTLAMKSQYSIRLYELLKSYEYLHKHDFAIMDLKHALNIENIKSYARFPDFKRNILDIALREINDLTDIRVSYTIIKSGRKYAALSFSIQTKTDVMERLTAWSNIEKVLNPRQTSMFDLPDV